MNERFLRTGEPVKKGQTVGTIGLTGQTSGPHVHVGYGIRSLSGDGLNFGKSYYKLTDRSCFSTGSISGEFKEQLENPSE